MKVGHQKEDMLTKVTFSQHLQNISEFQTFSTYDYGNCYTLQSTKYRASRSGFNNGIKLTMNLEVDEYSPNFADGYGIRMVFHQPGTFPMPAEEGLTLSANFETSIGLKVVNVSRLGPPYGQCSDGKDFKEKFGFKYTTTSCYEFCRVQTIIDVCKCTPHDAPDLEFIRKQNVTYCDQEDDAICKAEVQLSIELNSEQCDCPNPCSEIVYATTLSGRTWPNRDFMEKSLMKAICMQNKSSMVKPCRQLKNGTLDYAKYGNTFAEVLIYFEDLNYETITQAPLYETSRFLSDIGGLIGLFLGASVLTLFEFLQLLMEIALHICGKHDRTKEKSADMINAC